MAGSEQIINGKVTSYQRFSAIAHMTNRITNKNGVKLLAAIAVFVIAFAGISFITDEGTEFVSAETNETTAVVKDLNEFNKALNNDNINTIIVKSGTYETDSSDGYKTFIITRALTIKAEDPLNKPQFYGSFVANAGNGSVVIDGLKIMITYMQNYERNAVNILGTNVTVKNCEISMDPKSSNLTNGICIWPSQDSKYTIENNKFVGFTDPGMGWSSTSILVSEGLALDNYTGRFGEVKGETTELGMTIPERLAMISANTFEDCEWCLSVVNYKNGANLNTRVVGTYDGPFSEGDVFRVEGKDFTLLKQSSPTLEIKGLNDQESITISKGVEFNGVISFESQEESTLNLEVKAGMNGLTISKGSFYITGSMDLNGVSTSITQKGNQRIIFKDLIITTGANISTISIPNVTVEGIVSIAEDVEVTGGMITVSSNSTLDVKGNVESIAIVNNGTVSVSSNVAKLPQTITGTGTVNTSAIQKDAQLGGTINSETGIQTVFSVGQVVTLISDTELTNKTVLTIKGTMVIPEGITLTIENSAALVIDGSASKLINNGTIVVESEGQKLSDIRSGQNEVCLVLNGGALENNGIINLDWETDSEEWYGQRYSMYVAAGTVRNAGTLTISEDNTLGIYRGTGTVESTFINMADGTIISEGGIVGFIDNAGSITIDGFAWGTISLVAQDAQVQVISLTTNVGQPLVINDSGLKFGKDKVAGVDGVGVNAVTLDATAVDGEQTIGGIVVSCNILTEKNGTTTNYSNQLFVNGEVDYTTTTEAVTGIGMTISGEGIVASEKFSIPEKVSLSIGDGSVFKIAGESSIEGTITTSNSGKVIVTGKLVTPKILPNAVNIEASYYKISKDLVTGSPEQNIYTNLADAVAAAPKDITVTGDVEVESNIDIPKGTSVKFDGGEMTITKDGFVTVADGAKLTMTTGKINGVLSVENKKNISGTYTSDVVTSDDVLILYSGLAYALSNAVSGQTVKISTTAGPEVVTSSDIEIKDGVTLDTNSKNLKIDAGYTLTVNGTLFLNNGTLSVGEDEAGLKEKGAVVLNGAIKSITSVEDSLSGVEISGAYYTVLEKSSLFNYVEPVKNAASKASTFYNQSLTIVGEQNLGDVTFTGTNDAPITIITKDKVTGGTITLDYATFILGDEFTGTISDGKGQAVLSKVTGASAEDKRLTFTTADVSSVKTFSVKGDVSEIGTKGSMDLSGITVGSANLKEVYFGNDVVINGSVTATSAVIDGKVTVKNEKTLVITGDAYVTGALEAAAKTDSKTAGKVTVKGCLFVGFDEPTLGANASVSGSVAVEKVMYVMAGFTIDPSMIEDMDGMVEFYVDGKLYMTAYAKNTGATLIGLPEYDLDDADVDGWYDENGNKITSASSMPTGKISAKINYNIYSVTIIADEGIGTVAVDGVVAVNYIGNIYIASNLAAGEHKVTYTVKNGYEGTAKLYFDGKEASAITLSGDPEDESNFTYTLQGVTPAASVAPTPVVTPASDDDDMGLTEYLLIVLVILAAILVVVVAIRMMRS